MSTRGMLRSSSLWVSELFASSSCNTRRFRVGGTGLRLTQLIVQNFRMLKELKLDGLKGLNVFIGPNATGKSTALQAASSLFQASQLSVTADDVFRARPGSDIIIEGTLMFDQADLQSAAERAALNGGLPDPPGDVAGWLSDLLGGKVEAMFRVRDPRRRSSGEAAVRRLLVQGHSLSDELAPSVPRDHPWIAGTGVSGGTLANLLQSAFEEILRIKSMFLPTGRNMPFRFTGHRVEEVSPQDAGPWMLQAKVEDWSELRDYQDGLRAFLPHLLSLRTNLSSTQQGQFELGAEEEELPGTTPADRWSSGTLHLALTLLGLAGLPKGSVMLIEEPELSLHPYALRRLMDQLREAADSGGMQFFMTTHSPVVTEGVRPATEDHALWRFSRGEDGSAEATSCTTEAEVVDAIDSLSKAEG